MNYVFFAFTIVSQRQALSYFVDVTCHNKIEDAIDEVRRMANSGADQLGDAHNDNMGAAFKQIFKIDRSTAMAFGNVSGKLDQSSS